MEITQELVLEYPCEWEYKLFIHTQHDVSCIVNEVIEQRVHTLISSKSSKGGVYNSYSLTLLVHSDDERTMLFNAFKSHDQIKFVL